MNNNVYPMSRWVFDILSQKKIAWLHRCHPSSNVKELKILPIDIILARSGDSHANAHPIENFSSVRMLTRGDECTNFISSSYKSITQNSSHKG